MLRPLSDELHSLLAASATHPRHVLAASIVCRQAADKVQAVLRELEPQIMIAHEESRSAVQARCDHLPPAAPPAAPAADAGDFLPASRALLFVRAARRRAAASRRPRAPPL